MLFNSIDFAVFLPIVFILYWFVTNNNLKIQNVLIVAVSYIFYGWWNWKFLYLILLSTLVDYSVGLILKTEDNQAKRKLLLWISILVNLGFLGFFKYYNFFLDNFVSAFSFFGTEIKANSMNIILPVGISFYTFQTLSYTIDVYKRKLEPTKDFIAFAAFVCFFPQLVAGPIERAKNFLPQFYKKRTFDYAKAVDGMRQILWGLFKKVVIADNCAEYANMIFNNPVAYSGSTLVLGAIFFTFQIYGDFSGYSDIAIGTSRLFGFTLRQNFAFPFFSRDVPEIWRKWHISLTTWFRDYLFIPLIRVGKINTFSKIGKTFILFIIIGFWHGANWTFVVWGILHAFLFIPSLLMKKKRKTAKVVAEGKHFPSMTEFVLMLIAFSKLVFSLIIFRAESLTHASQYLKGIFQYSLFEIPEVLPIPVIILTVIFIIMEWIHRDKQYGLQIDDTKIPKVIRWCLYLVISFTIAVFFGKGNPFIYFQF